MDILIVEGSYGLSDEIQGYYDIRIGVDCDPHIQLTNRLFRDPIERGFSQKKTVEIFTMKDYTMWVDFVKPTLNYASLIIQNSYYPIKWEEKVELKIIKWPSEELFSKFTFIRKVNQRDTYLQSLLAIPGDTIVVREEKTDAKIVNYILKFKTYREGSIGKQEFRIENLPVDVTAWLRSIGYRRRTGLREDVIKEREEYRATEDIIVRKDLVKLKKGRTIKAIEFVGPDEATIVNFIRRIGFRPEELIHKTYKELALEVS